MAGLGPCRKCDIELVLATLKVPACLLSVVLANSLPCNVVLAKSWRMAVIWSSPLKFSMALFFLRPTRRRAAVEKDRVASG